MFIKQLSDQYSGKNMAKQSTPKSQLTSQTQMAKANSRKSGKLEAVEESHDEVKIHSKTPEPDNKIKEAVNLKITQIVMNKTIEA